jgi:hypothetical protein
MRLMLYNAHKLETEPSKCNVVRMNVDMGKKGMISLLKRERNVSTHLPAI